MLTILYLFNLLIICEVQSSCCFAWFKKNKSQQNKSLSSSFPLTNKSIYQDDTVEFKDRNNNHIDSSPNTPLEAHDASTTGQFLPSAHGQDTENLVLTAEELNDEDKSIEEEAIHALRRWSNGSLRSIPQDEQYLKNKKDMMALIKENRAIKQNQGNQAIQANTNTQFEN